jgi:hypothetical protein
VIGAGVAVGTGVAGGADGGAAAAGPVSPPRYVPGTAGAATCAEFGAVLVRTDARPTTEVGVFPAGATGMWEISETGVGRVQPGWGGAAGSGSDSAADGQSAPPPAGGGGGSYTSAGLVRLRGLVFRLRFGQRSAHRRWRRQRR